MWNELKNVVTEAIDTINAEPNIFDMSPEEYGKQIVDEAKLKEMLNVIDLMIAADNEKNPAQKARKTETAFVALHKLNTSIGGFGDNIDKAAKKRSQNWVTKYPILKRIQPLLEKLITFFFRLERDSFARKAEKSYSMFHEKVAIFQEKKAANTIQKAAARKLAEKKVTMFQEKKAANTIQKAAARKLAEKVAEKQEKAATKIQKVARSRQIQESDPMRAVPVVGAATKEGRLRALNAVSSATVEGSTLSGIASVAAAVVFTAVSLGILDPWNSQQHTP